MKSSNFAVAAALALAAINIAAADDLKIGVVNLERVLREAVPAINAQKKLEKEFAAREQELQKASKQIKDLQAALDKENATLSESERRAKEQDLARMNLDYQRMQREYREDANLRRNEELASVFERANKVVQEIATTEKFDLILQDAVYISPRIDITDKVIKALAEPPSK
ncbi:MAG TPA: OmpH family outer membrane protein [Burkholderiales bacterium]|nr:OmpH family outer membrane protein [Burkholderiales bacterium]